METPFKRRVQVPHYVVEQIARAERADGKALDREAANFAGQIEQAAIVNLNDDRRPDLIVEGDGGANITGFWLFRHTGRRWELVLSTRAAGLSIGKVKTNGYRDVTIEAASAVTLWSSIYKFRSGRYVPFRCWEQQLGVGENGMPGSRRYFKCADDAVKPYR